MKLISQVKCPNCGTWHYLLQKTRWKNLSPKDDLSLEKGLCEQISSCLQWRNPHPSHVDSWRTLAESPCLCFVTGKFSSAGFALPVSFSLSVRWSRQQGKKGGNDTAEITVSSHPNPWAQLHAPQAKKDKFSWNRCFKGGLFQSEEEKICFVRKPGLLSLTKQELRRSWLGR